MGHKRASLVVCLILLGALRDRVIPHKMPGTSLMSTSLIGSSLPENKLMQLVLQSLELPNPRTCLLLIKTENPYDLSPDCASSPATSSRKWYCSNCSLFPVFSIGQDSLHTAPHKQEGFSLFTPWQSQAVELVWTSRQMVSPERSNNRASGEAGEG